MTTSIGRHAPSAAEASAAELRLEPAPGGIAGITWLNRDLGWLFALRAIRSFAQGYLGIITPLYLAKLGYDAVHIGIVFAVAAMVAAGVSTATGLLSDRFGRKLFLTIISLMMGVGGVWFALTRNFAMIAAAAAIGSIGRGGAIAGGAWGPFYPAAQALVAEQTRDYDRTQVFGALSFVGVISAAIGSLLATLPRTLERVFGLPTLEAYRLLFLLGGLLGGAMALAVIPVHELHVGQARAARDRDASRESGSVDQRLAMGLSRKSWRLVWRFMVTNATNGAAIGMLGPFVVYWFYRRFGVSAAELGTLFFFLNLTSAVPYLMAGRIALSFGSVRAVVVTRAIGTILLFAVAVMPTFLAAAILYSIRTIFNVISLPVRQSYLMGVIDHAERASAAGLANLPSQITSAAGPYVAGLLMQHLALALPLEFSAAMQGLNTLLYWLFFRNVYPPEEMNASASGLGDTNQSPTA